MSKRAYAQNRRWTPADDRRLRDLRLRLLTVPQLAEAFTCTPAAIASRLHHLGVKKLDPVDWPALLCQPHTIADLAERTGREASTIRGHLWKLRKKGLPVFRSKYAADFRPKRCLDCGDLFKPVNGRQQRCTPCGETHRSESEKRYKKRRRALACMSAEVWQ